MKKKIIIGVLLALVSVVGIKAFAHSRMTVEEKAQHITEKMIRKLSLTETQRAKVYEINLARVKGHYEAHEKGRDRETIVKVVDKWSTDLKQVLTEEQAKKLRLK